jgi:hypothetical protein
MNRGWIFVLVSVGGCSGTTLQAPAPDAATLDAGSELSDASNEASEASEASELDASEADAGCTTTLPCHSAFVDLDSGACLVVPNSYTCQGGLCYAGVCCTGCFDGVTCQPGHAPDACGQGGINCRVNPTCP